MNENMSHLYEPKPAKLIVGFFTKDKDLVKPLAEDFVKKFGPVDLAGPWFAFDFTDYYEPEMGRPLFRRVLAFEKLIEQKDLATIKVETIQLEQKYFRNKKRRVNIDPGYLMHERFVLATAKNFAHRIYIGQRIYADLTLIYTNGSFHSLPWTYPDYREKNMLTCLNRVRNKYIVDFKKGKRKSDKEYDGVCQSGKDR